ncbi:uncharacterized protein Z520_01617 [Fonsecaea multimorphosa CBS 102226]|uniref:DUF6594 domain-containing protein n=1 Tax=Fonsecaea multimorphosa CBS 102226 TaxID=1442371 RepID=A0A0D2KI37_9EURO|nr:uncharacterized protein Z520_01617 [Fonsecaea multimorphosa CBS 102226]KIY03150.1 hypothetical protein Z520_01617 [Fonsecaea multimorphosa CBS 102226]OAL30395.1 hypothetical protein AYO22_01593 [Fonsecaea multimorphosa]
MSGSVRDQGRRRHSQTYAGHRGARSSKLSLLTAVTTGSHGSTDSSSTLTQESYSKSTSSSSKRSRSTGQRRPSDERRRKASPVKTDPKNATEEKSMSRESVDVFAFLVKDDEPGAADSNAEQEPQVEKNTAESDDSDSESIVPSMHSDSGISMGDSTVHSNNDPFVDNHLPPLLEDAHEQEENNKLRAVEPDRSQRLRWRYPEVPPATHKPPVPNVVDRTPSPMHVRARMPQTPDGSDKELCSPRNTLSGYDLIADRLASGELPPVFRSFKKIYFRLLLQLQDEISEMEEQLAGLDAVDGHSRLHPDGSMSPASRRLSWQWGQSDLPAHRLHVLGRLSMKLEQYYQVLSASQRVRMLSSSPTATEIAQFQAWLQERSPLSLPESKFLDNNEDLISLKETTPSTSTHSAGPALEYVPICILTMTLLPLLCFKFVTGVLNRLILITIVLAAGYSSLEKLDRSKVQQHRQWVIACFGVSFLAALFF